MTPDGPSEPLTFTPAEIPGPVSRRYRARRLRLHYVDWGNPAAAPLMLVHGGRDHCRSWDWVAADLRRDHHVLAPDLRGHGDSDWAADGDYSAQSVVYDLAQLAHQQLADPFDLVAHSFGGLVSLRYAGVYPERVRRLVVIEGLGFPGEFDPPPPVERRMAGWIEAQRAMSGRLPKRYAAIADAVARMRDENRHLSAECAEHLTRHGVMQNEDGSFSWKFDNHVRLLPPSDLGADEVRALWSRITCPVLLVHGSESWVRHPAEAGLLDLFRNARVLEMPGCGHWPHHDRRELFVSETRAFLAGG